MKDLLFILLLSAWSVLSYSQEHESVCKHYGPFYEEYLAFKTDTAIKDGKYIRKYKNFIIEQGSYKENKKFGRWAYFSLDGVFEFEYDYNTHKVIKISSRQTSEEYMKTPVLFLGSPIIPYLFMVNHIVYADEAKNKNITGKIVLAIRINSEGQITSLFIKEKLHPLLNAEVMRVAKTIPSHWQWIPATYKGKNINSEYLIDIQFDLTEEEYL